MVTLSWVFLNTGQDTLNQSFCWECTVRQITSCMVEEWVTTDRPLETMQPNNNIAVEQDAGREERTNHHNGRVSESQSGLSLTVQPPQGPLELNHISAQTVWHPFYLSTIKPDPTGKTTGNTRRPTSRPNLRDWSAMGVPFSRSSIGHTKHKLPVTRLW